MWCLKEAHDVRAAKGPSFVAWREGKAVVMDGRSVHSVPTLTNLYVL